MKKIWFVLLGHFVLSVILCLMTMKIDESGTLFFFEPRTWTIMVICFGILNLPGIALLLLLALIPGAANLDFFSIGMAPVGSYLLMILFSEITLLFGVLFLRKLLQHRRAIRNL
jgi:hypothetical protein